MYRKGQRVTVVIQDCGRAVVRRGKIVNAGTPSALIDDGDPVWHGCLVQHRRGGVLIHREKKPYVPEGVDAGDRELWAVWQVIRYPEPVKCSKCCCKSELASEGAKPVCLVCKIKLRREWT